MYFIVLEYLWLTNSVITLNRIKEELLFFTQAAAHSWVNVWNWLDQGKNVGCFGALWSGTSPSMVDSGLVGVGPIRIGVVIS